MLSFLKPLKIHKSIKKKVKVAYNSITLRQPTLTFWHDSFQSLVHAHVLTRWRAQRGKSFVLCVSVRVPSGQRSHQECKGNGDRNETLHDCGRG